MFQSSASICSTVLTLYKSQFSVTQIEYPLGGSS